MAAPISVVGKRDDVLLRDTARLVTQDRTSMAELLAHLAEVDVRRLYAPAGYDSMFGWCVGALRMSEDEAYKRIQAARAARRFPVIYAAVADGRVHLTAVVKLAPYLTDENVDEFLAAAVHKTKAEVELLLAEHFPRPGVPARLRALPGSGGSIGPVLPLATSVDDTLVPEPVVALPGPLVPEPVEVVVASHAPGRVSAVGGQRALGRVRVGSKVTPLAPRRFKLELTIGQETHDKLRHAQALLGHQIPSGDMAQVFDRALDALIVQLEERKFAATAKPREHPRPTTSRRHIPARVKRAVRSRDGDRCTFVSRDGRRCEARARLEFDHIDPVARGGQATVGNLRLRCRTHNQLEAERVFEADFMSHKLSEAHHASAARPTQ
jgi:HNH endonuclease